MSKNSGGINIAVDLYYHISLQNYETNEYRHQYRLLDQFLSVLSSNILMLELNPPWEYFTKTSLSLYENSRQLAQDLCHFGLGHRMQALGITDLVQENKYIEKSQGSRWDLVSLSNACKYMVPGCSFSRLAGAGSATFQKWHVKASISQRRPALPDPSLQ